MGHRNRIIRRAVVPFVVLAALLGADALPSFADDGLRASPSPRKSKAKSAPKSKSASKSRSGPGLVRGDPRDLLGAQVFKGQAFDTCHTPSSSVMRAWRAKSPFGAVGIYIGGRARACPNQVHLDRGWVRNADRTGWKLLPVYVGSQSPCVRSDNKRRFAMSHDRPAHHGAQEGRDAVRQAKRLGMTQRSALYLDMESYNNSDPQCAATTLSFIQGWNRAVRKAQYIPGLYSSANSGIQHMEGARKAGRKDLPTMLWFARWRTPASLNGEPYLDDRAWQPHRRIHQYDGNVQRTYGGYSMNIDRNVVDAPVAVVK
jgi:hypothetical protein